MISRVARTLIAGLVVGLILFGCKDRGTTEVDPSDSTDGGPVVRKPNIYLYPPASQRISVTLAFPFGGRILECDPDYGTGWRVFVEPSGRINRKYDYLYYEAQTPDRYQYSVGLLARTPSLPSSHTSWHRLVSIDARLRISLTIGCHA